MVHELVGLAKNPVPAGASLGSFKSFDGTEIRTALWQASRGPKLGTVCLFQGRTEFIEKYFEVVADLRRRGFAVATMDWRGQGGSGRALANPRKGHVGDFSEHDEDLKRFMREIVLPDCPPPFYALAHSMGGNILLRAAAMPGLWFDKIVVSAPMVRLHEKQLGKWQSVASTAATVASYTGLGSRYVPGASDDSGAHIPFEGNELTSDRERYARNCAVIEAAPHLALGGPTWGWMRAAFATTAKLAAPDFAQSIKVPLLFLVADDDTVVSSAAIKDFAVHVKLSRTIVIPHARHEILQEKDELRQQFWAAFDAFTGVGDA